MNRFFYLPLFYFFLVITLFSCDQVLEMELDAPYDTSISTSELSELMVNDPAIESDIAEGLKVWRKSGMIIEGASCNNCHSPDALDLAFFEFSDDNIRRRAVPHVGEADAEKIVDLVHAIREKYQIAQPKDPFEFRLMQPGPDGKVLPGITPEERDVSFAKHVSQLVPTLMGDEITSLIQAHQARDEILAYNLQKEPIGIPLPLWASDMFHGEEFGTVDEWLPNFPGLTTSRDYTLLQNEYIKNPTEENFWAMFNKAKESLDFGDSNLDARNIERNKFFSMLIGQHILRNKTLGVKGFVEPGIGFKRLLDPAVVQRYGHPGKWASKLPYRHIWDVAEFARKPKGGQGPGPYHGESIRGEMHKIGYEEFSIMGNNPNFGKKDFETQILTSWFWLHTQFQESRHLGYFNTGGAIEGYYFHASFRTFLNSIKGGFSQEETYKHPYRPDSQRGWGLRAAHTPAVALSKLSENDTEQFSFLKKLYVNAAWVNLYLSEEHAISDDTRPINGDAMSGLGLAVRLIKRFNPERHEQALEMYYKICGRNSEKASTINHFKKPVTDCDTHLGGSHN